MSIKATINGKVNKNGIESKLTTNGNPIVRFGLTSFHKKSKDSNEYIPTFIKCAAFGELAEELSNTLKAGDKVLAEGRLTLEEYVNKDGIRTQTLNLMLTCLDLVSSDQPNVSSAEPVNTQKDEDIPF